MSENNDHLHFLIVKQMKRANLQKDDIAPSKHGEWHDFIARVSRTYSDQEQERYLLERSMEISSQEMMALNKKLEYAQKIARLGYWQYDREHKQLLWSKETFSLTGVDPAQGTPSLQELIEMVHVENRSTLVSLMDRAFAQGQDFEIELRFKNLIDDTYHWHYIKGHPDIDRSKNEPIRYLSGIAIDITERKQAEEKMSKMHNQLLAISRQAGMAEVATFVLHNIGNILNSANVSISLILEKMSKTHIEKLIKTSEIIKEHLSKKDEYLTQDPKGMLIPDYLMALSKAILDVNQNITMEINNIHTHLNHIKDIVALQNDISGIAGVKETIVLNEIVDLAIQMGCPLPESKMIQIIKDYQYDGSIVSEKSKLLQILVNLVRNARDSVLGFENTAKSIKITIKKNDIKSSIEIIVCDNGAGISNENLMRIFSLGFTTKPQGHGYGLHSSAIAAIELGGTLKVESEGIGKGASFIIEMPLLSEEINKENIKLINEHE